jgi:hypothetical protein
LQKGNGYIDTNTENNVSSKDTSNNPTATFTINTAILGYYIGAVAQSYLIPVWIFEGNKGSYAFVSAVQDDELKN